MTDEPCCVYKYEFPNGKLYFGIAKDVAMRHKKHLQDARGRPRGLIHKMMNKYQCVDTIKPEIVYEGTRHECMMHEVHLIAFHKTNVCEWGEDAKGYNVSPGGEDQYHSHKSGKVLKELLETIPEFLNWHENRHKRPRRRIK